MAKTERLQTEGEASHVVRGPVIIQKATQHLELVGHVDGDDVAQQPLGLVPHGLDVGAVLVGLLVAVVVQPVADLELPVEKPDQQKEQEEGQDGLGDQMVKGLRRRVRAGGDRGGGGVQSEGGNNGRVRRVEEETLQKGEASPRFTMTRGTFPHSSKAGVANMVPSGSQSLVTPDLNCLAW